MDRKRRQNRTENDRPETLIAQPDLRRMLGNVSDMTIWRWRRSGLLPNPMVINRRNYYRESDIVAMQSRLTDKSCEVA